MEILLVNPNYAPDHPQPPLGLLHIASAIRKWTDWEVKLLDCNVLNLSVEEALRKVGAPDTIGISAMTPNTGYALEFLDGCKERWPELRTVMGGPHMTVLPEETMRSQPSIDYGVIGEGELTIVEFLRTLDLGWNPLMVPGVIGRIKGKVVRRWDRPHCTSLDQLPFPAYDLLETPITKYKLYAHRGKHPFMSMVCSRGCPFNCAFCSKNVWGRVYNTFSVDYVLRHITYLVDEYGIKNIQFYDDSFTLQRDRVLELCQGLIAMDLDVHWCCETRVDLVDREMVRLMKKAKCQIVSFGVESGVQRVLDTLLKGITLEQTEKAVNWCSEAGLEVVAFMMLGSPTETREEIEESIRFTKRLPLDFVQWSICTPYYGTKLYKDAIAAGVEFPTDWEEWVWIKLVAIREDSPSVLATNLHTSQELAVLQSKAYRAFYFSPKYFWRRLKKCTTWSGIMTNVRGLQMILEMLG